MSVPQPYSQSSTTDPSSRRPPITWVVIVLVGCGATAAYQWWLSAAMDGSHY